MKSLPRSLALTVIAAAVLIAAGMYGVGRVGAQVAPADGAAAPSARGPAARGPGGAPGGPPGFPGNGVPAGAFRGVPAAGALPASDSAPRAAGFRHAVVVTANPLATQAGLAILKAGGAAADAAVAVQAVLGLVEPQSSGLGGGGFITYYDAATRRVSAYDGRERAPAGATATMFLDDQGHPLPFPAAVLSGRSAGAPGAIAALGLLHDQHGKLPWRSLFADAERLASVGFIVSPRLAGMIGSRIGQANTPDARRYFTKPDGTRYMAGDRLRNPAYAHSIGLLAAQGPRALYHGPIAQDIVARVHEEPLPGTLSLADLAGYRPIESAALCEPWGRYRVCEPPPPSGGIGVLEALKLLEHTNVAQLGPNSALAWLQIGEAEQLMYADRDAYVGDPRYVHVPIAGMFESGYLSARAALIGDRAPAMPPTPGHPTGAPSVGADHTVEPGGTSQFVIVDAAGNVVSMTTTVESIFGDGRMVDGFFLNNQLTDFSFQPLTADGRPAANAVAAGKQPRSAMSPTIVIDEHGRFVAATGSSGGPAIIAYVLKTLLGALDWHLSMQTAIDLPSVTPRGTEFAAETPRFTPALLGQLQQLGMTLRPGRIEGSGIQGVLVGPDGTLEGAADPRREGTAAGF